MQGDTHAEAVQAAGRPTLGSLAVYFLPLSPMNPSPPTWLVGYGPALVCFCGIGVSWARGILMGGPLADASLDTRPAWLQAVDLGERVVLIAVHVLVAQLHVGIASSFKSTDGAAAAAEARALAFTDAPRGAAALDNFQWPPGPYLERPVLYMRFHTLIDCLPLPLFVMGLPDLAYMAMLAEKAGGVLDHLHTYGGTLAERQRTLYPIMLALPLRLALLMLYRAQPSTYLLPGTPALDAAAHVAGAVLVGFAIRPIGWAICGLRPAARCHPGRQQTPYKKAT